MRAYDVIYRTTHAMPDNDSLQWVDATHMKEYRRLSIIGLSACFVCLGGALFMLPGFVQIIGLAIGGICLALRTAGRRSFGTFVIKMLDTGCDPVLFCRRYLAFLAAGRPSGDYTDGVWKYAYGLLWQGQWDQAIKLIRTLEPEMSDPNIAFAYDSFMADCAFALRDPEKLMAYIQAMKSLRGRRVERDAMLHANELEVLYNLLALERNGDFAQARGIIEAALKAPGLLPIEEVAFNLHLAECTEDPETRHALLSFVHERGGTTWCANRARMLLAEDAERAAASARNAAAPVAAAVPTA